MTELHLPPISTSICKLGFARKEVDYVLSLQLQEYRTTTVV